MNLCVKLWPRLSDDHRLKSVTHSHRTCIKCDMFEIENISHIVVQWPAMEPQIRRALYSIDARIRPLQESSLALVLTWLLGGTWQHELITVHSSTPVYVM